MVCRPSAALASKIACLSEPAPLSLTEVTVKVAARVTARSNQRQIVRIRNPNLDERRRAGQKTPRRLLKRDVFDMVRCFCQAWNPKALICSRWR